MSPCEGGDYSGANCEVTRLCRYRLTLLPEPVARDSVGLCILVAYLSH